MCSVVRGRLGYAGRREAYSIHRARGDETQRSGAGVGAQGAGVGAQGAGVGAQGAGVGAQGAGRLWYAHLVDCLRNGTELVYDAEILVGSYGDAAQHMQHKHR